jgi:uncharacterized protein YkwD
MRLLPLGLVVLLPACAVDDKADEESAFEHNDLELELHELVNGHREDMGLESLALVGDFSAIARGHSEDMGAGDVEFGHDGFDDRTAQMIDLEGGLVATGENVAWVSAGWDDPAGAMFEGWLDSPGHRENIEGDWNQTGMGAAEDGDGGWYATQLFALMP